MTNPTGRAAAAANAQLNRLFISQMLQFSRAFETRGLFGGGAGEAQFASFLRDEYANRLADTVVLLPTPPSRTTRAP
ncbi:hypothetical protein CLG85_005200 [Yangia mangrovi]|uniref:Uncharacterized protein n=1 Tax=Alloyangia mangrovi TaxID=1779329 RepID=A0A2A3JUX7_9RHOB|nr:hypothetical protein [Alloyangia mangrovi]MCT4369767.1 hypothetical protein [Alloyangia mangrovi]